MTIKNEATLDVTIALLNELLLIDRDAMISLFACHAYCNDAMANHPIVQVMQEGGSNYVGILGILNGLFGVDDVRWGGILAVYTDELGDNGFYHSKLDHFENRSKSAVDRLTEPGLDEYIKHLHDTEKESFANKNIFVVEDEWANTTDKAMDISKSDSKMDGSLVIPEPAPVVNDKPHVWDLVIQDMQERDDFGLHKYGNHLQPFNGRNAMVDTYQELLDAAVYIRQLIFETYGK